MINIFIDLGWIHILSSRGGINVQHLCQFGADSLSVDLGSRGIDDRHGMNRQSAFHCPCALLTTDHRSWSGEAENYAAREELCEARGCN